MEVNFFNELKADAGPARGLKGLGDYRSLYVNNNDHANHRPKEQQTWERKRSLKYLQGPDGCCLRREVVGSRKIVEGHPPDFTDTGSLSQSGNCSLAQRAHSSHAEAFQ